MIDMQTENIQQKIVVHLVHPLHIHIRIIFPSFRRFQVRDHHHLPGHPRPRIGHNHHHWCRPPLHPPLHPAPPPLHPHPHPPLHPAPPLHLRRPVPPLLLAH